jgi:hypothetical protein
MRGRVEVVDSIESLRVVSHPRLVRIIPSGIVDHIVRHKIGHFQLPLASDPIAYQVTSKITSVLGKIVPCDLLLL